MKKKVILIIVIILVILGIDQAIKIVAMNNFAQQDLSLGIFNLTYHQNTGVALGVNKDNIFSTIAMDIFVMFILVLFVIRQFNNIDIKRTVYIGMVLAGGASNLIDRVFYGGVVDYIDIGNIINGFPIFNIADCAIIVGLLLFAICTFMDFSKIQSGQFTREKRKEQVDLNGPKSKKE